MQGKFSSQETFNVPQLNGFFAGDEGDRHPASTGSTGSANAVDIISGDVRELVINDMG